MSWDKIKLSIPFNRATTGAMSPMRPSARQPAMEKHGQGSRTACADDAAGAEGTA